MPFANPLFVPEGRSIPDPVVDNGHRREVWDAYTFWDERIVDAVNVAMATRRPLLVTGPAGSGKSTLALAIARELRWTYIPLTVTSRTEIGDLTAGFDAVRRLADAQARQVLPAWAYVEPGVLWWAFEPLSAATRGRSEVDAEEPKRPVPGVVDPRRRDDNDSENAVVLIDEIDKAEPDLPNDLLEPLDRRSFTAPNGRPIALPKPRDVLVVVTSNRERRLPPAFLRRCVQLELSPDNRDFFIAVAEVHFGERDDKLYERVAVEHLRFREAAEARNRRVPSTAEFLDTLRACLHFGETPDTDGWHEIVRVALWKETDLPEEIVGEKEE